MSGQVADLLRLYATGLVADVVVTGTLLSTALLFARGSRLLMGTYDEVPRNRVVGISKLARLVDVYAKRLQVQEKMTAEIAACIDSVLKPYGVAVVVEGAHECMTTRGIHKSDVSMVTSRMLGVFRDNPETRQEFLSAINLRSAAMGIGT